MTSNSDPRAYQPSWVTDRYFDDLRNAERNRELAEVAARDKPMQDGTISYGDFVLKREPNSSIWRVESWKGGKPPKPLGDQHYTSHVVCQEAIEHWLDTQEKEV